MYNRWKSSGWNQELVLFRDKTEYVNSVYTTAYQKTDEDPKFVCYEIFIVN